MLPIKRIKFIVLFLLFFIILTEKVTLVNTGAGLLVALFVYGLNQEVLPDFSVFSWKTAPYWVLFIVYLLRDVLTSNLQVAKVVLSRDMSIAPEVVQFKSRLNHSLLLTFHANAITLTPGTMTVEIDGNVLQVHCLSKDYAEGLGGSDIENTLLKIESHMRQSTKGGLTS